MGRSWVWAAASLAPYGCPRACAELSLPLTGSGELVPPLAHEQQQLGETFELALHVAWLTGPEADYGKADHHHPHICHEAMRWHGHWGDALPQLTLHHLQQLATAPGGGRWAEVLRAESCL